MADFIGYVCIGFTAIVLAIGFATAHTSKLFFSSLIAAHPDMRDKFPEDPLVVYGTRSHPISASRMRYLKAGTYRSLSDPALRDLGRKSWLLLCSYATSVTVLILLALTWGYLRDTGP